jgi:hypothetical protein
MNVYIRPAKSATHRHTHPHNGKATGSAPRCLSGEYLAKNHLDARGRAKLAADLIEGRARVGKLTNKQLIQLCRSNAPYVAAARKLPAVAETLAQTLASATPQEIALQLGTRKLWELLEHATS